MFYDALTLRAYLREVTERFEPPWFVQKFSQVGEHDFLLACRLGPGRGLRWLISLQPQKPALLRWQGAKPQGLVPSAFTMLVRKHLQGRSLDRVEALYPERLVRLGGREHSLIIELLDRQPNLVLVGGALAPPGTEVGGPGGGALAPPGTEVIGSWRRPPDRDLRRRRPYQLPARPALPDATSLTSYQLEEIYLADPPAWPLSLLKHCFGLSPAACRWLGQRFQELAELPLEERLRQAWQAMWRHSLQGYRGERLANGQLTIWADSSGPARALLDLEQPQESPLPGLESERARARQSLVKARQKLQQRLLKLAEDRQKVGRAELLQREGELLLTYQHQVERGATRVELTDWDGETRLSLALDPALPVLAQAQRRLKRAAKYRRSLPIVEARVQETEEEIGRVEERLFQVEQAESLAELAELAAPRRPSSTHPARGLPGQPRSGPRRYQFGQFQLLVGRSPRQNDELIRRHSARDDLWFHVKDSPGAHVLLKTAGASPEQDVVEAAAMLAARYSSRADDPKVLVSFTSAQRVKKPPGAPPGLVVYSGELTLWVSPAQLPPGLKRQD